MSETAQKRASAAGIEGGTESFDKLGAFDKSAANARANMLFRRNEAQASGGDRSKFLSSTGMSEEDFAKTYGKDASMKDVYEQEQKMIDTDIKIGRIKEIERASSMAIVNQLTLTRALKNN